MSADPRAHDPRLRELLHRSADGSASDSELQEFREHLAASPSLAEEFEAIREVVVRLDAVPAIDPPASLKRDILAELRRRRPEQALPILQGARRTRGRLLAWAAGILLLAGTAYLLEDGWRASHGTAAVEAAGAMGARSLGGAGTLDPADLRLTVRKEGDRFIVGILATAPMTSLQGPVTLRWDAKGLECLTVQPGGADLPRHDRQGAAAFSAAEVAAAPQVVLRIRSGISNPQEVVLEVSGKVYLRTTLTGN